MEILCYCCVEGESEAAQDRVTFDLGKTVRSHEGA